MKLLKENLFLVIVGAVTLAGTGACLVLINSADQTVKQYVAKRTALSDRIAALGAQRINQTKVEYARHRVEAMRRIRGDVEVLCLKTNRGNKNGEYRVLTFDMGGKKVAAFPVDPTFAARDTLRLLFPNQYRQQALALLTPLRPAEPPSEPEIKEEADRIARASGLLPEGSSGTAPPSGRPAPPPGVRPSAYTPPDVYSGIMPPAYRPAHGEPTAQTGPAVPVLTAMDVALRRLVLERAQTGWIYANEQSLYLPLAPATHYGEDALWMAQVGLWVQSDIIDAIDKTIKEGERSGARLTEKGVPASAVKRLLNTRVLGYVMKRTVGPTGSVGMGGEPAGGAPPVEAVPGRMTGEGGLTYLTPLVGSASGASQVRSPPFLTGRASNQLYDVIHYEFTVLMPAGHLLSLYRNLLLENYHTILDVRISVRGPEGRAAARETLGGGATRSEQYYYYGTDPNLEVNIVGEMLLLADFTRGRYDAQAKAYDKAFPPLMPVQFLGQMTRTDPEALRAEDRSLLEGAGAAPALPSSGRLKAAPSPGVMPPPSPPPT